MKTELSILQAGLLSLPFSFFLSPVFGQNGCEGADFETGDASAYELLIGNIDSDGIVTVDQPGQGTSNFMLTSGGVDPIAQSKCIVNQNLSTVAPGGGAFSLRIGDENGGKDAQKAVLKFTVTPDIAFFLLQYAVVLEDPNHEDFEQPRFEVRIFNAAGQLLPCGEYKVRASGSISGFENCGNWRVLPWTTVGFELSSYIGEDIQIELLTTDCSKGAHGGYAYFDASCQPLRIELNNYCPGDQVAILSVTEGFDEYLWNTGETTSTITVEDPIPGTVYSVTATGANGCQVILSDTLPTLVDIKMPVFDALPDTTICPNTQFTVAPTGANLENVYSVNLGYFADAFTVSPSASEQHTLIATDDFGCSSDTVGFMLTVADETIDIAGDLELCIGESTEIVILNAQEDAEYSWEPFGIAGTQLELNSPVSTQVITVFSEYAAGCSFAQEITLDVMYPFPISFNTIPDSDTLICEGEQLELSVSGMDLGNVYWGNDHQVSTYTLLVSPVENQSIPFIVFDATGCDSVTSEIYIRVETPLVPMLPIEPVCTDGPVTFDVTQSQSQSPVVYEWSHTAISSPVAVVDRAGTVRVNMSNICGAVQDSVVVVFQNLENKFYLPNAFSPNGDGINDYLKPFFYAPSSIADGYEFKVFDRWGGKIYESFNPFDKGWDGTFKGKIANSGNYSYFVFLPKGICDESYFLEGSVLLIK